MLLSNYNFKIDKLDKAEYGKKIPFFSHLTRLFPNEREERRKL